MKKVVLGADHGGYELKDRIAVYLKNKGYEIKDMGVNSSDSVDYPDFAEKTALEFLAGDYEFGVVCCGTGIGISISANKVKGIRCALPQNIFAAQMSREHNNANMIAFGGRIDYPEPVEDMVEAFINAEFQGGRHEKRVNKIMALER